VVTAFLDVLRAMGGEGDARMLDRMGHAT